jgi:hypothetical protein
MEHSSKPAPCWIKTRTLLDISHGGAWLQVRQSTDILESFKLVLDELKIKTACRIVWRNKDEVGVEFGSDTDPRR